MTDKAATQSNFNRRPQTKIVDIGQVPSQHKSLTNFYANGKFPHKL